MPYLDDPRGRVTLNLQAPEFEALAVDATRAGYASPGKYAMALVRARGAAPRPVLDENGRQRVARLRGKLAVVRAALAATEARADALAVQLLEARQELDQRPTRAQVQQAIEEGVKALSPAAATSTETLAPALLTPEEKAEARRQRARQRQREAERTRL